MRKLKLPQPSDNSKGSFYVHLVKSKTGLYTVCGIAVDKIAGTFDISECQETTKDVKKVTCPECLKKEEKEAAQ